jgi:hypothetical protein
LRISISISLWLALLSSWLPQPRPTAPHPLQAIYPNLQSFSFTQIQIDVLKELQNLDPNKSAGQDNLVPLFQNNSTAIVATYQFVQNLFRIVRDP